MKYKHNSARSAARGIDLAALAKPKPAGDRARVRLLSRFCAPPSSFTHRGVTRLVESHVSLPLDYEVIQRRAHCAR